MATKFRLDMTIIYRHLKSLICSISYKAIYIKQAICTCFDDAVCSLGLYIINNTHQNACQSHAYLYPRFTANSDCQDQGYSTDLLDPTQVESKNTIVKSNGLSRVLMLNLWIFSLEKNKIRKLWLK